MQTPNRPGRGSPSPKHFTPAITSPKTAGAKIGRRNFFDDEEDGIYTFHTPLKVNGGNGALDVEASATYRNTSVSKPPPPPMSPTGGKKLAYNLMDDADEFDRVENIETPGHEKGPSFLELKGGTVGGPPRSKPPSQSLARRGLGANKGVLKCPKCGKADFDSRPMYNSHTRNCQRGPASPKRAAPSGGAGFGRMGLLLQIRRLQEEEDRKKAEEAQRKEKEEREAKIRAEEERRLRIEQEKRRLLDEARKKKELDQRRNKYLNDLKEAAGNRNLEKLRVLLKLSSENDVEAEHVQFRNANEVLAQLEELEELRIKVELARKQKEEEERKAREQEEKLEQERKKRTDHFEKAEEEADADSDDEAVQQRRLDVQRRFEEKKARRNKRKGLGKGRVDADDIAKRVREKSYALEKRRAMEFQKEDAARKVKLAAAQADIAAEKKRIMELNRLVAMEKESADNEALKNNLLELENKRQEADMAKKQEELERRAEEEKRKLAEEKHKVEADLAKQKDELDQQMAEHEHHMKEQAKKRAAELEQQVRQSEENIKRQQEKLAKEREEMKRQLTEDQKREKEEAEKQLAARREKIEAEREETEKKMRLAKEEADMKAQEIAYQLQRMEEEARDREIEMEKKEQELHEKIVKEAEEVKNTMVTETKEKMKQDIERHKEALKVLEREKELKIQQETLALKEKQLAHEEAEKQALQAAERLRHELEAKMRELSDKDDRRKDLLAKEIQRYREESQKKLAEKEDRMVNALMKRRADLENKEEQAKKMYEANCQRIEEEMSLLEAKQIEENQRRSEMEAKNLKTHEDAMKAAENAMKSLLDREAQLKEWEEEILRKTKEEAKKIREAAEKREQEVREQEKQILGDATREAADRAAEYFKARELEFKEKERQMIERMETYSNEMEDQKNKEIERQKKAENSLEARIQARLDAMERRDEELRLREEKIRKDAAVQSQQAKLLEEKEKLLSILQKGKESDLKQQEGMIKERERQLEADNLARLEAVANSANRKVEEMAKSAEEYGQYYDENGSNEATQQQATDEQMTPEAMKQYLRRFFMGWDTDHDGLITTKEFYEALMTLPQPPSDEVAQQLVTSMDKNGSGVVNYEEFVQYYISEMGAGDEQAVDNQTAQHNGYDIAGYENEASVPCKHCVDQPGAPATHCAAAYGHIECLEALIANGAPLNALDKSNRTAIFCAAANNHFHCVAVLLDGIDASILNYQDQRGDTAVHAAACNGNHDCLQLLLQSGAEPNLQNKKGNTPSHLVKNAECLQVLYENGGDVFALDNTERTAMFTSAAHGRVDVLSLLLEIDNDATMIDFADGRGDTPLHGASCNGHTEAVRLLLQTAANPNVQNRMGFIAGYLAESNNHAGCVGLLEEYGGYKRAGLLQAQDESEAVATEYDLSKWAHTADPESGHTYYYHVETGVTQWEEPPGYSEYIAQAEQQNQQHNEQVYDQSDGQHYDQSNGQAYDQSYYYQGTNENDESYYGEYYQGYDGQQYTDWDYWYWNGYGAEEQEAARVEPEPAAKLNKDYMKMMTDYANLAPYRGPSSGSGEVPTCVICQQRPARDVFLPCEHTCVCKQCMTEHAYVGSKGQKNWKPKKCPVCNRRAYKAVAVAKYLTLPKDYGPAPKLSKAWVEQFKANTATLLSS
jgi:trichohyalin